ncbi:MAG: hypothetical protein ABSE82_14240 [Nitrososphaerales archaeon]
MTLGQSGQEEFGAKFMLQEHSRMLSRFVPVGNPGPNASQGAALSQPVPTPTTGISQTNNVNQVSGAQAPNATQGSPLSQPIPTPTSGISQNQNVNQVSGSQGPNAIPGSVSSQSVPTPAVGIGQSQNINQPPSVVDSLQDAATYLSFLLIPIGFAVINTMLSIRTEQYLYVQTVNATRNFFKTTCHINEEYLVLPVDPKKIEFGANEAFGRTFWEAMIVSSPTSLLVGFLVFRFLPVLGITGNSGWLLCVFTSLSIFMGLSSFVSLEIIRRLRRLETASPRMNEENKEDGSSLRNFLWSLISIWLVISVLVFAFVYRHGLPRELIVGVTVFIVFVCGVLPSLWNLVSQGLRSKRKEETSSSKENHKK